MRLKAKAYENTMEKLTSRTRRSLQGSRYGLHAQDAGDLPHLSNAADRGDEQPNIISSIVMKHT